MSDNVERLAYARNETVKQVEAKFTAEEVAKCPKGFTKHLNSVRDAALYDTGVDSDGLAWVQLKTGQIFYSPVSHKRARREYQYVQDTLQDCITEETYLAAIDVVQRYLTDFAWPPDGIVKRDNGNIIELGAYLGHKTIRFAEELVPNGKVLAVEMVPENCEILQKTIDANGLSGNVEVRCVGVWNEPGRVSVYSKGRQRNSILPIEKLADGERFEVEVTTLDNIVSDWPNKPVDLVFASVNGVEIEAIEGLIEEVRNVHGIFVAAPYSRGQKSNAKLCAEALSGKGYELIDVGNPHRVVGYKREMGRE